jgi:hypothetical protein
MFCIHYSSLFTAVHYTITGSRNSSIAVTSMIEYLSQNSTILNLLVRVSAIHAARLVSLFAQKLIVAESNLDLDYELIIFRPWEAMVAKLEAMSRIRLIGNRREQIPSTLLYRWSRFFFGKSSSKLNSYHIHSRFCWRCYRSLLKLR